MKKNKLLYFLIASVCTLTSCNSNSHTEQPIDTTRPIISADGKTITYGLYPQQHVSDSFITAKLNLLPTPEENGWYLYEGKYYAKAIAEESGLTFDSGTVSIKEATYWFRCEPIIWNILSNTNGEYYIVSSLLLDAHYYYKYADGSAETSNYKYSDIRTWLNEDFYNLAFSLGNEYVQTTTVDNSASTTDSTSNKCACENTEDKVFLPSYQDYINSSYGFSTSTSSTEARYCKTTDWARVRGADYSTSSSYFFNGDYWTRSPYSGSYYGNSVWEVRNDGTLHDLRVNSTSTSVRPAITIKIA